MKLAVVPCSIQDAREFVRQFHRHHAPPLSGLFAVACADGDTVRGVAIVGRPVARMLQDAWTAEVTRLATDGTQNACSLLYGACWRAARALGYRKLVTYTLASEPGNLIAGGGMARRGARGRPQPGTARAARAWNRAPTQDKIRWEAAAL